MERRLTTILASDVVGYSRLMAENEAATLTSLKRLRSELFEPKTVEYRGRVIKLMGDGTLMEFASVIDAVNFAVDIQKSMAQRAASGSHDQGLTFRIGINIGDVIVEGDDIYGDGVNLASRIESLAEPGGICVARNVYDQVHNRVDASFEDLGDRKLKNIPDPVQVFRVPLDIAGQPQREVSAEVPAELESSQIPAIAVLPFDNMSGDAEQEYFTDGLSEDLITELSRFHSLRVVARNSTFSFKGKSPDINEVGSKLGVRFVVEGSARKAGNRVRVTAQLIDADTGNHLWAERYDRDLDDIFAVQDELVGAIVTTVGGQIEAASKRRAIRMSGTNVQAYDLCLQAQALQDRNTKEDYRKAEACLIKAIELDPGLAPAHHQLSLIKFWCWMMRWPSNLDEVFADAFQTAEQALKLDDSDGLIRAHLCMLHIYRRAFDEAGTHIETALRLNPNDIKVLGIYAFYLSAIGEPERAIALFGELAKLDPVEPAWITRVKAIAHLTAGQYEDAVVTLKSLEAPVNITRGWLASSLAHAGHLAEANRMLAEFLRVAQAEMADFPGQTLAAWKAGWHGIQYKKSEDTYRFFYGLRKAGLKD